MAVRNRFRFAANVCWCAPLLLSAFALTAAAQSPAVPLSLFASPQPPVISSHGECVLLTQTMCDGLPPDANRAATDAPPESARPGAIHRGASRLLRDQAEIWSGPFKKSSLKWD